MPFRNDRQRRAAFANMSAFEIKELRTKAQHYIVDERKAVGEYDKFKVEIADAGLPQRLVDMAAAASKDEHRHMNDMIEIKGELGEFKEEMVKSNLQEKTVTESKNVFKTGKPVTFNYMRNTQPAPKHPDPSRFGQDIEPSGKYMVLDTKPDRTKEYFPEMEQGVITFNNPIVIENVTTSGEPEGWKSRLSVAFGDKKGKALTKELIKKGYDGVVTVGNGHTSEIVSLKVKR